MAVARACWAVRLFPGVEAAFDRAVAALPADVLGALADAGLASLTAFRRGTDAWFVVAAGADPEGRFTMDPEARFGAAAGTPALRAWDRAMRSVVVDAQDPAHRAWFRPMFFTAGRPQPGPFRRQLLCVAIDPDRGPEYDARHADPWPDMLDAIAEAGSRESTGFRRGGQVLFYGEHHPDLATVYERITGIPVDTAWGDSFAETITTMTDEDGRLLIVEAVAHWETGA